MTDSFWEQIATRDGEALRSQPAESRSVIIVSTATELTVEAAAIVAECTRVLRSGGCLFAYGQPHDLPSWGEHFRRHSHEPGGMAFKYWFAMGIDDSSRCGFLKPSHRGLLMFIKNDASGKSPMPPHLHTDQVKVPHSYCPVCKLTVKDWGGKKHQMNPKGSALSDVWRDLPRARLESHNTPDVVLGRIRALTEIEGERGLHVVQLPPSKSERRPPVRTQIKETLPTTNDASLHDVIHLGDCVAYLNQLAETYTEGVFDLAFADPPYNLAKGYDGYRDDLADQHYLEWCERWLDGMVRTLKPGGSLFVLNLPKWALHHAAFLNSRLEFRHWIAWDALSDPRGKIMPAHYALLYYTKPGGKPVFNYKGPGRTGQRVSGAQRGEAVLAPDSPKYCLRGSCVKKRKLLGDDEKVELSDVWFDIHRIRHKRDRDAHPCQLPEKLMERIIRLTTNRGDLVLDPFGGAGTTAIAAIKLGRRFVAVESDAKYVEITKSKIESMKAHADMFGEYTVPRRSTLRPRGFMTKKAIETHLQQLAQKLGRVPTEEEIHQDDGEMLAAIDRIYPNRGAALKRCKVVLQAGGQKS